MEQIREKFSQIEDTRHAGYVEHNLVDVLILVMGSVASGMTELADMMVYFANKIDFYREHFGIEKYPSKCNFSNARKKWWTNRETSMSSYCKCRVAS